MSTVWKVGIEVMTPEQIEKWRWMSKQHADGASRTWEEWHLAYHTEFARLVAQDTWERARNVCFAVDETGDYVCHTRDDCANAIDAAAAQEAK
jgi:hypothetical protein